MSRRIFLQRLQAFLEWEVSDSIDPVLENKCKVSPADGRKPRHITQHLQYNRRVVADPKIVRGLNLLSFKPALDTARVWFTVEGKGRETFGSLDKAYIAAFGEP